jgi:N-acetylglucosamine kinase-like BadF-type ATPase
MKIVVEAGGTKCKWGLIDSQLLTIETSGFNPNSSLATTLSALCTTILSQTSKPVDSILWFGAGCAAKANKEIVGDTLRSVFNCNNVQVFSDLEGAAIALFGNKPGIAAILGTGAAAGYYNGQLIEHQTPSLGYLLGDEGSGAYIGKELISKAIRGEFSANLCKRFFEYAGQTPAELIKSIYSANPINSYLAGFVSFASTNIAEPEINHLVSKAFEQFIEKHIEPLNINNLPIGFVGGVAWQFADILRVQFEKRGQQITIMKDAFERLCECL